MRRAWLRCQISRRLGPGCRRRCGQAAAAPTRSRSTAGFHPLTHPHTDRHTHTFELCAPHTPTPATPHIQLPPTHTHPTPSHPAPLRPTRDAAVQQVLAAVAEPRLHQLRADGLHPVGQTHRLAKRGAVVEAACGRASGDGLKMRALVCVKGGGMEGRPCPPHSPPHDTHATL